ncbi:MAG TPA: pilus assembly protein N-terminal domain-containing protein [Caulobacteraceae bacterium]
MRRLITVCLLTLAVAASAAAPAFAQSRRLSVELDHSTRLGLTGAASSVIVGNPAIADVTVVDERTLFISGRGYGVTDVVVVDQLGRTVYSGEIVVTAPTDGQVRVWRGAAVTEMACAASCAPTVRSGQAPAGAAPAAATPTP